jgi:hypothetical protein
MRLKKLIIILFGILISEHASSELFEKIYANDFKDQKGTYVTAENQINGLDNGDYVTYGDLDFGPIGTTQIIRIRYAKGCCSGKIELRRGDSSGLVIGEYVPPSTGGWVAYKNVEILIDDVEGVNDLTIVAKDSNGVMNLEWIELAGPGPPTLFPTVNAVDSC